MTEFAEPTSTIEHNRWLGERRAFASEFAKQTGGTLIELPMASEQTGVHSAVIYKENYDLSLTQVFRGARSVSPAVLDNQAASMLRDPSDLEEEGRNDPGSRRRTMLPIVKDLEAEVIALAKEPTIEKYEAIGQRAPAALKKEMQAFLRIIRYYIEKYPDPPALP
jgi:hypothetical protein